VAGLAILDPSTTESGSFTCGDVQSLILERLPQLPPLRWRLVEVPLPERLGDVHFVRLAGLWDDDMDVVVVLVRRRGGWEQLGSLLSGREPEVLQSTVDFDNEDDGEED